MTNAEIITKQTVALVMAGQLQPDEQIHTFNHWKSCGYKVKKGEHAIAKFSIWKKGHKDAEMTDSDGETKTVDVGRMFLKESCFFASHQVEKV